MANRRGIEKLVLWGGCLREFGSDARIGKWRKLVFCLFFFTKPNCLKARDVFSRERDLFDVFAVMAKKERARQSKSGMTLI